MISTELELRRELAEFDMEDETRFPEEYFAKIGSIRQRISDCGMSMMDHKVAIKVLATLPSSYSNIVTLMEKEMNRKTLTLVKLQSYLHHEFKKIQKGIKKSEDDLALAGFGALRVSVTHVGI